MKKFNLLVVAGAVAFLPYGAQAAFPGNSGNADTYNISITKVELCKSSACGSPYVIGTGTKTFDISSGTAGADVGNFIDISGIPLYQTWTHVRATLSTTITISASGTDDQGVACRTNSADTTSSHTALGIAQAAGGAGTTQTFVVPNTGAFTGNPTTNDYTGFNLTKVANSGSMTILYPLSSPYICTGVMPKIDIKFDTQNTIKFLDTNGPGAGQSCAGVYALPPTVTITVSDP